METEKARSALSPRGAARGRWAERSVERRDYLSWLQLEKPLPAAHLLLVLAENMGRDRGMTAVVGDSLDRPHAGSRFLDPTVMGTGSTSTTPARLGRYRWNAKEPGYTSTSAARSSTYDPSVHRLRVPAVHQSGIYVGAPSPGYMSRPDFGLGLVVGVPLLEARPRR
ncbi:hypothetical protein B0H13DRAFT_2337925 [Mycena leptocephala]|nr:hypothetical protein B0H13DRAFT_2337925 [Mycena leptocephala]